MMADNWRGWELRRAGPANARRRALLLPGGLCTAVFYADQLADPRLASSGVCFIAATPPGFGGRPAPEDVTVESYARLTAELSRSLGCHLIVGHSYSANVVIEMAATGLFTGPIVLLSPIFSREDEEKEFRMIAAVSRIPVLGRVPWMIFPRLLDSAMKGRLPEDRHEELVAEMRRNDMAVFRLLVHEYFAYLDRHGSLVGRLCASGVDTWVVRGDRDEIGLSDEERRALEACPTVTMVQVPDAGHMVMTDQPARTTDLILEIIDDGAGLGGSQDGSWR